MEYECFVITLRLDNKLVSRLFKKVIMVIGNQITGMMTNFQVETLSLCQIFKLYGIVLQTVLE